MVDSYQIKMFSQEELDRMEKEGKQLPKVGEKSAGFGHPMNEIFNQRFIKASSFNSMPTDREYDSLQAPPTDNFDYEAEAQKIYDQQDPGFFNTDEERWAHAYKMARSTGTDRKQGY